MPLTSSIDQLSGKSLIAMLAQRQDQLEQEVALAHALPTVQEDSPDRAVAQSSTRQAAGLYTNTNGRCVHLESDTTRAC